MTRHRNMVVAQSGGPSPVINNSLRGIIETARDLDEIGTVYGGRHGIEGVLKEELLDLSAQPAEEIALLCVHAGGRLDRHLPLQAQAQSARRFRAGHRRLQSPSRRIFSVHRRQRLDGHGQQGRRPGPRARAGPGGRRRSQDDRQRRGRQRVQAYRSHARLRLGGQILDAHESRTPTRKTPARRRPIRCW